jgi:hypothetical protein
MNGPMANQDANECEQVDARYVRGRTYAGFIADKHLFGASLIAGRLMA